MDTTTVALVASGIGAAGAVAGQVVSQIFTGRREAKRLKWEEEQRAWERQRAAEAARLERARLFADGRRKAYMEFLRVIGERRVTLSHGTTGDETRRSEVKDLLATGGFDWWKSFRLLSYEIAMLNAEVGLACGKIYEAVIQWEQLVRADQTDEAAGCLKTLDAQTGDLLKLMRADLSMEPVPDLPLPPS